MKRNELIKTLLNIDFESQPFVPPGCKVKVVLFGSSAFLIKQLITRETLDIDTFSYYSVLGEIMNKYNMNCFVNAYCDCVAYNYEDRLEKVDLDTKSIDYYTLSLEDMVIMKIYAFRPKDIQDITSKTVLSKLDFEKLQKIIDDNEVSDSCLNERRYNEFLYNYKKYLAMAKK